MKRTLVAALALVLTGCSAGEQANDTADGTWVGTITTEGNVTTVINESRSVWGGTATLVEELSIGVEASKETYMVGQDASPPLLRVYGASGGELYFDDIRAASIDGGLIVVLTPPGPAVHVLDRDSVRS